MKSLLKQILPSSIWNFFRQQRKLPYDLFRGFFEGLGYNIVRKKDYYSPLPSERDLRKTIHRWNKPSRLLGIEYNIEEFKKTLLRMLSEYYEEFSQYPSYKEIRATKAFGPGFSALDGLTLFLVIRYYKPKRYFEVGSGVSTYYCSLAAQKNEEDGCPLEINCIEPNPYKELHSIPEIKINVDEVQNVDVSYFQDLQEGDILFIDSSHILKLDGDVSYLFLEVFPSLNKGVIVHIHDVHFPFNIPYPPEQWIFGENWPVFWNEAMLLQAFLCFNNKFKIIMSTPLLRYHDEKFLQNNIPIYETIEQNPITFSSIWLQKVE